MSRPFYLITVFWGEEFRRLYTEYCLPSLLGPNNIPRLTANPGSRFLIATTRADWAILSAAPIFRRLERHLTAELIAIDAPGPGGDKYRAMSAGHKAAAARAVAAQAYGMFISPDAMLSDGSVAHVQALAQAGRRCVLASALRFAMEPVEAALRARGLVVPGEPIALDGRALAALALPWMHAETRAYEWESPYFTHFPVSVFWRIPGEDGIVLHSQSWGPLLVDYGTLDRHDTTTLDQWTMDGDYVYRNFGSTDAVHVITDSDDALYVSFTPSDERPEPRVRNWCKGAALRCIAFGPLMDPLKQRLIRVPLRIHAEPLSPAWARVEADAAAILERELRRPRIYERLYVLLRIHGWKGLIPQSWRPWLRPFRRAWLRVAAAPR